MTSQQTNFHNYFFQHLIQLSALRMSPDFAANKLSQLFFFKYLFQRSALRMSPDFAANNFQNFIIFDEIKSMKEGYHIRDQALPHFITATVVDWVDVFSRKIYRDVVIDCFEHCIDKKGMILYGYVIMSNHIHMIIQSKDGTLSDLIRDFKKFTAKTILNKIQTEPESRREWMLERFKLATESHSRNVNYQFWQYGNHPEEIYTNKFMWSKLDYIHLNPVRAEIVTKASHYIYSSASNYVNDIGLVKIEKADNPIVDIMNLGNLQRYNGY